LETQTESPTEQSPSNNEADPTVTDAVDEALNELSGEPSEEATADDEATGEAKAPTAEAADEDKAAQDAEPAKDAADETTDDLTVEPEGLSERASTRFKGLVESRNDFESKLKESEQRISAIQQAMESSNANADDMAQFLETTRLSRSASMEDKRQALALLDKQRNTLALEVGDSSPSTNALDMYPDLKQKVESMDIEPEEAMQIAQGRHIQAQHEAQQQQTMRQQQFEQQSQASQQTAISQVEQMAAAWQANDMDYKAKEALIMPQMQQIRATLPPEQWGNAVQMAYESVSAAFSANKPAAVQPSPISNRGVGGKPTGSPNSLASAVDQALSGM